jgi:hypothetical protein
MTQDVREVTAAMKLKRPYVKPSVTVSVLDVPVVLLCTTGLLDCAPAGYPGCCIPRGQACEDQCF